MKLIDESKFATKKELFAYLVENKERLIAQKKAIIKQADGIGSASIIAAKRIAQKAAETQQKEEINVVAIINTTKVLDGHMDVHMDGLWDKSIQENKNIMHIQEHQVAFDKIIADGDDLKAYTNHYTFKELGFDYEGKTQALVFDSTVRKERNSFMFEQYNKGRVKNHSVGMQYVKLVLAVNDDDYGAEKEAWDKYFPEIAVGKEIAESKGYFWAVTEAKAIEGSAVPIGSNTLTPTHSVKNEPPQGTQETEPPTGTLKYSNISKHLKL